MKLLNWKQMLIAALVPASAELVWVLYNTYVPLWLQAGNTAFSGASLQGFGLSAATTGLILTFGNVIALVVNPVVGILSDSTHSRFGRRKPWYTVPAPVILITICLIPFLAQHSTLTFFLLNLVFFLFALAITRGPATVLLYDITPSKFRGMAAALSGVAGGTAGILGAVTAAALFGIRPELPFWVVSGVVGAAILSAAVYVREPAVHANDELDSRLSPRRMIAALKSLSREHLTSTILLILNTFFSYIAFGQMQAFTSSYSVSILGLSIGNSSLVYAMGGAAFILFSFPASAIATKWLKRKSTQLLGGVLYIPVALLVYFFANPTSIWLLMALLGATWALVMVTQEPMMLDSAPSDILLGTYSAILQVARTLGFVVSPILGGWIIQISGSNYNIIWLVMAGALLLAMLVLLPVKHGEAREEI
jgi:maltose/moltooligosaccharide transporter